MTWKRFRHYIPVGRQRQVMCSFDVFFDIIKSEWDVKKQSSGWWFEMPQRSFGIAVIITTPSDKYTILDIRNMKVFNTNFDLSPNPRRRHIGPIILLSGV